MTKYPELFAALAAPFDNHEVKLRAAAGGRQLHYITARTAMNRLDSVLGPENWWDDFTPLENSVICRLTIRLPDGQTLTKADAGGYAGMADSGDDDKSGFSDAFKRAAAKFGVSRYLYRDGMPTFVREDGEVVTPGVPPPAPEPVRPRPPADDGRRPAPQPREAGSDDDYSPPREAPARGGKFDGKPPHSGKALFTVVKLMEKEHGAGLVKYLNGWAKEQGLPGRMIDFNEDEVAEAFREAQRVVANKQGGRR